MSPRRANMRSWLVLAPLWLAYATYVVRFWHTGDDAYITFRYSRNLASGLGLRYNPGDGVPVEGYSNFLWMLAAVPLELLGLDVPTWMNLLSFGVGSLLLVGIYRALTDHLALRPIVAAATTALVVLSPAFTVWSTSGLETMAFAALLFATFERLVLARDRHAGVLGGLAAVGLALVRTEGIGWVAVILVLAAVGRLLDARQIDRSLPLALHRSARRVLAPLGQAVAVLAPCWLVYFAGRAWWFQSLSSNTFKAKVHLDLASLEGGLAYVLAFSLATLIPPLLLLGALPGARRRLAFALPAALLFVGFAVYAVLVGGDYMPFGRLLLPALPIGALLAGFLLEDIASRHGRAVAVLGALVAIGVGLLPAHDVNVFPRSVRAAFHFRTNTPRVRTEYQQWEFIARTAEGWRELGEAMAAHAQPGATWATGAIGAKGYYSGVHIYDMGGLVDPQVAEREGRNEGRSPGHEKTVGATFFLNRKPTYLQAKVVDAADVAREVQSWRYGGEVQLRYLPEAIDLGAGRHLVWLRRAHRGEDVAAAWQDLRYPRRPIDLPGGDEPPVQVAENASDSRRTPASEVPRPIRRLESFADPAGSEPPVQRPTTRLPGAEGGLRLYVSGHAAEAHLVDLNGAVAHTWRLPFTEAFPSANDGKGVRYWRHATLLPDGSLLAIHDGQGVVKIDRDSRLVWAWAGRPHHDLQVDDAGDIWVLTRAAGVVREVDPKSAIVSDHVTVLSPDGAELRSFSLVEALLASPHRRLLDHAEGDDPIRATSLTLLDGRHGERSPAFAKGNLLVSSRGLGALLVVDPERRQVVWSLADLADPRDVSVVADGGLLVFDASEGRARVVELDPITRETRWSFDGLADEPLSSPFGGVAQRLPGGDTLITDTTSGRALQVSPAGEVVWTFESPHRLDDALVAHLFGMWRVADAPTRWLEE